jgi:hypothetical protein
MTLNIVDAKIRRTMVDDVDQLYKKCKSSVSTLQTDLTALRARRATINDAVVAADPTFIAADVVKIDAIIADVEARKNGIT